MSFSISYNRLTRNNIKHIYTTKDFRPSVRRFQRIYNPSTLSRYLSETSQELSLKKRLYEDDDDYGYIPRAPAFRCVPANEMRAVVTRLSQPNPFKLNPRTCQQYQRGFSKYKHEDEEQEGLLKTPREVKDMVARLNAPIVCKKAHYHRSRDDEYEDDFDLTPVSD